MSRAAGVATQENWDRGGTGESAMARPRALDASPLLLPRLQAPYQRRKCPTTRSPWCQPWDVGLIRAGCAGRCASVGPREVGLYVVGRRKGMDNARVVSQVMV